MITSGDIRQLAGLLEGEGSFCYGAGLYISIGMTDLDVILQAQTWFGHTGKISVTERKGAKPLYRIRVCGELAAGWMMMVYPFMGSRRKSRIQAVLSRWRVAPLANTKKTTCPYGHTYDRFKLRSQRHRQCSVCIKKHNDHWNGLRRLKVVPASSG